MLTLNDVKTKDYNPHDYDFYFTSFYLLEK